MHEQFKQPLNVYDQLQRNSAEAARLELTKTAATLGAIAALGVASHGMPGGIEPAHAAGPAKAAINDKSGSVKAEQGIYLRDVSELPGYRMKVTKRERKVLADSTLTLLSRRKVANGDNPGKEGQPTEPFVVAGPLCESGDVFTRDADELLAPRALPRPVPGDLLFAEKFIRWNDMARGIVRVDGCRLPDGSLLLVELEDLNPFLSLDVLSETKREQFINNFITALGKIAIHK